MYTVQFFVTFKQLLMMTRLVVQGGLQLGVPGRRRGPRRSIEKERFVDWIAWAFGEKKEENEKPELETFGACSDIRSALKTSNNEKNTKAEPKRDKNK